MIVQATLINLRVSQKETWGGPVEEKKGSSRKRKSGMRCVTMINMHYVQVWNCQRQTMNVRGKWTETAWLPSTNRSQKPGWPSYLGSWLIMKCWHMPLLCLQFPCLENDLAKVDQTEVWSQNVFRFRVKVVGRGGDGDPIKAVTGSEKTRSIGAEWTFLVIFHASMKSNFCSWNRL